jgi:hypothetical protein
MPPGLKIPGHDNDDCKEFNAFFTGSGSASRDYIQMPSRWSDSQFGTWSEFGQGKQFGGPTFGEQTFAERACSLKWAFNAKPDLVLHLGPNKAICIEAKLESGVGSYQVKNPNGCFSMKQLKLQEFILSELLGYDTDFIIISKRNALVGDGSRDPWRTYSWHEIYSALISDHPSIAAEFSMVAAFIQSKFIKP